MVSMAVRGGVSELGEVLGLAIVAERFLARKRGSLFSASRIAWWMTGRIASRWERAATSGMTPPYSLKMSIWETTTLERSRKSADFKGFFGSKAGLVFSSEREGPERTAAAVSSQELSIARMFMKDILTFFREEVKF